MDYWDAQELACAVLGLNYDDLVNEGREDEIDNALYEKFEIGMEQFCDIVKALLPFTPCVKAGLSGTIYHAFVNEKEGIMIIKQPVKKEK